MRAGESYRAINTRANRDDRETKVETESYVEGEVSGRDEVGYLFADGGEK